MDESRAPTIAEIVGRNARELRGDLRTDDVAAAARMVGLKWSPGRISELERGKVSPTLPTLILLAQSFTELLGRPVSIAEDLLAGDDHIRIGGDLVITADAVREFASGHPVDLRSGDMPDVMASMVEAMGSVTDMARRSGAASIGAIRKASHATQAESRVARDLGITVEELFDASLRLWGKSFSEQRDALAGDGANAQKRGRIARVLKDEIRQAISNGND
ncbi:helix-turn-helix transcriptional regulator [Nocardia sp. NPDC004568]|uniref:helix-turn-helix domain-containing protein n=1 Tax=Nocardia sp. NPDC004568 TaxID=3154551 RepID=UPI0033ADF132